MIKTLNIIHVVLEIVILLVLPIVVIIDGFISPVFFNALLICLLLAHPMLYLIMMVIKEAKVLEYDTPKFAPVCMCITILLGCLIWYLFYHIEHSFVTSYSLWYGVILLSFAIPMIICNLLNKRKEKNKGPKFIKNNGR